MPPLTAGTVEDPRADGEIEDVDQPRDLQPVARGIEERLVLQEVAGVEVARPPVRRAQKNTGSRYAPKTSSSAARIS